MAIDNTEQVCTIVLDCTLNHDTSQNALIGFASQNENGN